MDVIALRGIRALGRHGANPGERDREQPFEIDVRVEIDLSSACASDELAETLDYADLRKRVCTLVQTRSFRLLERLAGEIAREIFRDPRVARATVEVAKPEILDGATPSVVLQRENPRYRSAFP